MRPQRFRKSTLLNLIAGLDAPDDGRVLLQGQNLNVLADHELADLRLRTIGFVFQAFNLIPALTVDENLRWPLEFHGIQSQRGTPTDRRGSHTGGYR